MSTDQDRHLHNWLDARRITYPAAGPHAGVLPPDPNDLPAGAGPFPYSGDAYHADRVRATSTNARDLLRHPRRFRRLRETPGLIETGTSDAMRFGTLVAELLAGPIEKSRRVFVCDMARPDFRLAAGKAARQFAEQHAAGRLVIWLEEYERGEACVAALRGHPELARFLGPDALKEFGCQAILNGVHPAKCLFDAALFAGDRLIDAVDVKTASDPSPRAFRNSVLDFGYHVQEAWYRRVAEEAGLTVNTFRFAVVGTDPERPYAACYELDDDLREEGELAVARALVRLDAIRRDAFDYLPAYSAGVVRLGRGYTPAGKNPW